MLAIPVKKTCVEVIFLLAPTRMFIKNQHYFYKLLTCRQHVADMSPTYPAKTLSADKNWRNYQPSTKLVKKLGAYLHQ